MGHHHSVHHRHHGHHGVGRGIAEAALIGGVAVTAATMASRPRYASQPLPRAQVVVFNGQPMYQAMPGYARGTVQTPVHCQHTCPSPTMVINQAAPELPLNVRYTRLVPEATEHRNAVVFFCVEVVPQTGSPWRVMRRFRSFHELYCELGPQAKRFPGAPFPRRRVFALTGGKLEARRRGLELWLQRALEAPMCAGPWLRPLRQFLEGGRQSASSVNPNVSQAMTGPIPPPATPVAVEVVLQIQVPAGVSAGQLLGVAVPGGRQLNIAVPAGAYAGQTLDLFYDPVAGTLAPLV